VLVGASWGAGPGKKEQWELLVRAKFLDARFVPAPSTIFETAWQMILSGELWEHVRASLGLYNTQADVDELLAGVRDLAARAGDSGYRWDERAETWRPVAS